MKEAGAAGESVTVWSPFLSVAGLAVDVAIGTVAGDNRVEGLGAVAAFKALAMPFATFGQDLFCGEHNTAATRATFAWWGLDGSSIDYRCLRSLIPIKHVE